MPDRADERARLNEALEHANSRIANLEGELEQEKQQRARIRADLVALDEAVLVSASPVDETASIRAPAEKLTIFRSLFRGRPDVYSTRFVGREGKQGYGPACANKFVKGVCELPRASRVCCVVRACRRSLESTLRRRIDGHAQAPRWPPSELRTESLEELSKTADQTLPLRLAYRYQAWATSKTFNRNTKETKQHREMITKLLHLARSGDIDAVVDYARQRKPFGRVGTLGQVLAARALVSLFRWGSERGILSSSAKTDFLFDQYVSSALPREFSSNPELMGPLFKVWSKPGALEAFSPSLACVVAIARKATSTKDTQKLRSTEIDKHHASFAPLVDVFACDSRIEPIVARTLKGKQPSTVVVRSSPTLQSVVDAVRGNT